MAFALADLLLLLKSPFLGGEVPLVVSVELNGLLSVGVSSESDGVLGVRGGEWCLLELEREKNDETLFDGESGGTGFSESWEVDPRRKRLVRRDEERLLPGGLSSSLFWVLEKCVGGVAGVCIIAGFLVIPLDTENVSIPNTPEWLSLVGVIGSGTSLDSVSSSSSTTVWHSWSPSSMCGGPMKKLCLPSSSEVLTSMPWNGGVGGMA